MSGNDLTGEDMALLRDYAQRRSETAFATLVSRHINLVYSIANRQVHDSQLAEEIAQNVFVLLAQKANILDPQTILSGWLCRTTRYVSADALKTRRRRQQREQESQMEAILNEPGSGSWEQIAPLLDEALERLGEKEQDAIALRFFEGKDLREVGAAMGIGEDAARMRVNRGIEKLREIFAKQGVVLSATTLAGTLAGQSVQAAPAGLAATVASVISGTTLTAATAIAVTKTVAMTTLHKTLIGAGCAIALGIGVYQAHQTSLARAEARLLEQKQAPLEETIQQLQQQLTDATNRLAGLAETLALSRRNEGELLSLRGEVSRLRREAQERAQLASDVSGEFEGSDYKAWFERIIKLKQWVKQTPGAETPEMRYLTDESWLGAAKPRLETPDDFKVALNNLCHASEVQFLEIASSALRDYLQASKQEFPTEVSQLAPYFESPAPGNEILSRYEVRTDNSIYANNIFANNVPATKNLVIMAKFPDPDGMSMVGTNGFASFHSPDDMSILAPALQTLYEATPHINNRKSLNIDEVVPYIRTPEQMAAYKRLTAKKNASK